MKYFIASKRLRFVDEPPPAIRLEKSSDQELGRIATDESMDVGLTERNAPYGCDRPKESKSSEGPEGFKWSECPQGSKGFEGPRGSKGSDRPETSQGPQESKRPEGSDVPREIRDEVENSKESTVDRTKTGVQSAVGKSLPPEKFGRFSSSELEEKSSNDSSKNFIRSIVSTRYSRIRAIDPELNVAVSVERSERRQRIELDTDLENAENSLRVNEGSETAVGIGSGIGTSIGIGTAVGIGLGIAIAKQQDPQISSDEDSSDLEEKRKEQEAAGIQFYKTSGSGNSAQDPPADENRLKEMERILDRSEEIHDEIHHRPDEINKKIRTSEENLNRNSAPIRNLFGLKKKTVQSSNLDVKKSSREKNEENFKEISAPNSVETSNNFEKVAEPESENAENSEEIDEEEKEEESEEKQGKKGKKSVDSLPVARRTRSNSQKSSPVRKVPARVRKDSRNSVVSDANEVPKATRSGRKRTSPLTRLKTPTLSDEGKKNNI